MENHDPAGSAPADPAAPGPGGHAADHAPHGPEAPAHGPEAGHGAAADHAPAAGHGAAADHAPAAGHGAAADHATAAGHGAAADHAAAGGHHSDPLKTVLSLLMAIVVVSGAVITWRSTLDGEEALREDTLGLTATVQAQGVQAQANATVYNHYEAYTGYLQHQEVGRLLGQAVTAILSGTVTDPAVQAQLPTLQQDRTDQYEIANTARSFFNPRYLTAAGSYDTKAELAGTLAAAAQGTDLQPARHFEEADKLRGKSTDFLWALLILGGALLCYTLPGALSAGAEGAQARRLQIPFMVLGLLLTLVAIGDALRIELLT